MNKKLMLLTVGGVSVAVVAGCVASWISGHWWIAAVILAATLPLPYAWHKFRARRQVSDAPPSRTKSRRGPDSPPPVCPVVPVTAPVYDENDPASLAQRMLDQRRYAPAVAPADCRESEEIVESGGVPALDDAMGIVPEGDVLLQSWRHASDRDEADAIRERLVHVEAMYLDRYPVTNRQFQQFVDDGGYEHMPLWDPTIWPAVLDFIDRTGHSGPRHWRDGHFPEGLDDHPVVGVSWYEGAAYARWAGKRLPSDPEWVKAGCWPVLTQGTRPLQRRYPWGDTMDRELTNLWGSGPAATVSVYELSEGVSVGGIYHLIGNVWEWTTSNFGVWDASARKLETSTPMKSIRAARLTRISKLRRPASSRVVRARSVASTISDFAVHWPSATSSARSWTTYGRPRMNDS